MFIETLLIPGYEILEHKDFVTFKWEESPLSRVIAYDIIQFIMGF